MAVSDVIDRVKASVLSMNSERESENRQRPRLGGEKFGLALAPAKGDPAVPEFFGRLYEEAYAETQRLGMHERWMANYVISRAKTMVHTRLKDMLTGGRNASLSLGLIGANIERTVANITARNPVASVQATSGKEEVSSALSAMADQWNNEEQQYQTLELAVKIQETYGTVIEKGVLDPETGKLIPCPLDITAFLPAPGKFHDIQKMPYCCHHYSQDVSVIERRYPHLEGKVSELSRHAELFLSDREDVIIDSNMQGAGPGVLPAGGGYDPHRYTSKQNTLGSYGKKGLVVEVWYKDHSVEMKKRQMLLPSPLGGAPAMQEVEVPVESFPGGIRLIVLVQGMDEESGEGRGDYLVAYDGPNPNINHSVPIDAVKDCYLFSRFPFSVSRSYLDTEMFWGFSQAETTGDIAQAIDELWRIIVKYLKLSLLPPVIIPRDTGIDKSQFAYIERLVLQPNSTQTASGIRFLEMPTPPAWLFQALDVLTRFFDRTSQIEDVDRGDAPAGIVAASAIQMLQERAAALIRAKIRGVDSLVRNRGRMFINMIQNFHTEPEMVNVSGSAVEITGISFIGEKFSYIVESGSTVIKTEAEERQMAMDLFVAGAIDQRALLESVKFRGWREVVERMAEAGPLEQAMEILVQAGLPVELVEQLYQMAVQTQGGPGDDPVARGGNSAAQNNQPMAGGQGGAGGPGMRGKAPQRENGGAPAKPGVPMTKQNG